MAQIDQRLLSKIAEKKNITVKGVYPLIAQIVHETFMERDLAALVLGSRLHIPIGKYSTPAQREAIRAYLGGGAVNRGAASASPPPAPAPTAASKARRKMNKPPRPKDNSVFVIHGRDLALRDSMFAFLSALGCKPIEFHQAVAAVKGTRNPFVGDVLDKVFNQTQALVVLFSPDDEVKLKDQFLKHGEEVTEGRQRSQARANVVFEAGMAMARHQEKTIMVQIGEMKSFSDIAGRHMVHLDNSFESRNDFVGRLEPLCKIDRSGNTWTTTGNFTPAPEIAGRTRKGKRS